MFLYVIPNNSEMFIRDGLIPPNWLPEDAKDTKSKSDPIKIYKSKNFIMNVLEHSKKWIIMKSDRFELKFQSMIPTYIIKG